jgi:hypothetical protein
VAAVLLILLIPCVQAIAEDKPSDAPAKAGNPAVAGEPKPAASKPSPDGQDTAKNEPETLVKGKVLLGGYGGPVVKVGKILGGAGVFVGGKGGLVINHQFIVGGGGFGLASTFRAPSSTPYYATDLKLGMGYGGASFEWIYPYAKVVHLSLGILLGGGAAGYYHESSNTGSNPASSTFFMAEPEAALEFNVVSFFRINLSFSWRITSRFSQGGLSDQDISGPTGSILLRFGKF